jgi:WD40 repeat protein/tRNA A-37 threonylcarbamoyl transferase component Bud32
MTALTPEGRALFLEIIDLPAAAQAERLAALRTDAPQLAAEVAALLAADAESEGFLEPPSIAQVNDQQTSDDDPSGRWLVGRRIGQYTLGARIGVGGMGTVFVAEQDRPKRYVALKLLRTSYATANLRRRFEREAEILGRLRHPGIAEIYEAGTHESELGPIPYFALEYIPEAKSITRFAEDTKLDVRARVDLLACVCDAVAEAHRHGIVHRDIKPSNVLIGRDGAPKLIDFGIARWLDDPDAAGTLATQLGDLLGTLQYMSPEQFDGAGPGPTAASDVYALGVVAYELVAGRMPYPVTRTNAARIAELVRTHVPEPLTRAPMRWRALDDVVQMALAKSPSDRYPNAAELAADLRRASAGEPVRARRSHRSHRLRTLAWRSRRAVPWLAAAGAAAAAIVIARQSASGPGDALATETTAAPAVDAAASNDGDWRHHIAAAERALAANDLARAKVELGLCRVDDRGWEWHRLVAQVDRAVQIVALGSPAHTLVHDPSRGLLVATTEDGVVHGLRAADGPAVPALAPAWRVELGDEPTSTAIDPARGRVYIGAASGLVHRRRLDDGSDAGSMGARGPAIDGVTLWHAGRELVVTRHDRTLERWDADALTRIGSVRVDHQLAALAADDDTVLGAWTSWGVDEVDPRDGKTVRTFAATEGVEAILVAGDTLYTAGWDDRITAFDRRGRGEPRRFDVQPDGLVDLVEPDADTLISAGRDGAIAIWDAPSGTLRQRLRGHDFGVDALAIGGDGRWLASVSIDGTLRTWDLRAPPIDRVLGGAGDKIQALAFAADGARIIAAIGPQWGKLDNDAVRAWSVADGAAVAMVTDHAVTVDAIAIARDGATIVTASRDGTVHVRDAGSLAVHEVVQSHEGAVRVLAFIDDGATFVSGGEDGSIAWWRTDGSALGRRDAAVGAISDAAWTSEGLVVGGETGLARLAGTDSAAEPLGEFARVTAVAALPDGTIVLGHADGTLARVDLATATLQWSAPTFGRAITDVAVSPDASRIATSNQDYRIRLYDAKTGEYLLTVGAHESVATAVAFSPDGRGIASGGYDRVVRLWHAPTAGP